jgi:hypothetical protein
MFLCFLRILVVKFNHEGHTKEAQNAQSFNFYSALKLFIGLTIATLTDS